MSRSAIAGRWPAGVPAWRWDAVAALADLGLDDAEIARVTRIERAEVLRMRMRPHCGAAAPAGWGEGDSAAGAAAER